MTPMVPSSTETWSDRFQINVLPDNREIRVLKHAEKGAPEDVAVHVFENNKRLMFFLPNGIIVTRRLNDTAITPVHHMAMLVSLT